MMRECSRKSTNVLYFTGAQSARITQAQSENGIKTIPLNCTTKWRQQRKLNTREKGEVTLTKEREIKVLKRCKPKIRGSKSSSTKKS